MSHSVVFVIMPKGERLNAVVLESILAPFSEKLEVPEYDKPCYCIGQVARRRAVEFTEDKHGTIESMRERFAKMSPYPPYPRPNSTKSVWKEFSAAEKKRDEEWKKLIAPYIATHDERLANDPDKEKPSAECDECKGTGKYSTTYNPKSRWDWYEIGGRWDNIIPGNADLVENVLALDDKKFAEDKDESIMPFAVLTPDGNWHERGKMGWWGVVHDEKKRGSWRDEARSILGDYKGHVVVAVDVHI